MGLLCLFLFQVYPLMAAMAFVTSMCVFQLTRNAFMNPDVRIKKEQRMKAVHDNAEEGEKYSQHGFRKLLYRNRPWIFPAANFSSSAGSSGAGDE
ncbi:hypothetical protein Taro_054100 [Colocasia esculenta]|uniref:Uncharacterized protein n=1 Tax=Colocasia esculenta TaxID=4460 RepID=A0A843XMN2_COLES|nr:hypothetical protein [Colocasia esculenta]